MAAALPPASDCGCSSSSSSSSNSNLLYPLHGVADPNVAGIVPPYRLDLIWKYEQWLDPIAGPPTTIWSWNPNLLLWQ